MSDNLESQLKNYGIPYPDIIKKKLSIYRDLFFHWNQFYSFMKITTLSQWEEHILDALSAYPFLKEKKISNLYDIGTGIGFPGLILALFLPDREVYLSEISQKKIIFLKYLIKKLDLKHINLWEKDSFSIQRKFHCLCSRAFSPMPKNFLHRISQILLPSGYYIGYISQTNKTKNKQLSIPYGYQIDYIKTNFIAHKTRYLLIFYKKND